MVMVAWNNTRKGGLTPIKPQRSQHQQDKLKQHAWNVHSRPSPVPYQCIQIQEKEVELRGLQNQDVPLLRQLHSGLQGILTEDVLGQRCTMNLSRALKVGQPNEILSLVIWHPGVFVEEKDLIWEETHKHSLWHWSRVASSSFYVIVHNTPFLLRGLAPMDESHLWHSTHLTSPLQGTQTECSLAYYHWRCWLLKCTAKAAWSIVGSICPSDGASQWRCVPLWHS